MRWIGWVSSDATNTAEDGELVVKGVGDVLGEVVATIGEDVKDGVVSKGKVSAGFVATIWLVTGDKSCEIGHKIGRN